MNTVRGVGGRFLLGPLRRAATAQAVIVINEPPSPHPRSLSRCYGPSGEARLHQRASSVALAAHPARWVHLRKRGGDVQTQ
jgi:hypothetical protein